MDDVLPPLSYAPDGLYESDIDTLIAEFFTIDTAGGVPPVVSDRAATNGHHRYFSRQAVSAALHASVVEPHRDAAA